LGGSLAVAAGLAALAGGLFAGTVVAAALGLAVTGLGMGVWDVAMNVEGAELERRLGRSLMPRLHAAFSLGTVSGALLGAGSAAAGVELAVQVGLVAGLVPVVALVAVRAFRAEVRTALPGAARRGLGALTAWRERRTLVVGLLVLAFAFTEGTANDWVAVALVDGYGSSETVGALSFGLFVTAMTAGRLTGSAALDRFGRVNVLRATAAIALVGLLLVVASNSTLLALAGALLWGVGASLGFPVGMSAAADDPTRAAARVSVVSSIGYTAFLAGPPLIGLLAERSGILEALLVVVAALVLGLAASGAARPLSAAPARSS